MIISFYADAYGKQTYKRYADRLAQSLSNLSIPFDIQQLPRINDNWSETCNQKPQFILDNLLKYKEPIIWIDADSVVKSAPLMPDVEYDIACPKTVTKFQDFYFIESGIIYVNYTPAAIEFLQMWIETINSADEIHGDHPHLINLWTKVEKERPDIKLVQLGTNFSSRADGSIVKIVESNYPGKARDIRKTQLKNRTGKNHFDVYWWMAKPNFGDWIGPYILEKSGCVPMWRGSKMSDKYLTCGSIIQDGSDTDVVWGSGILNEKEYIPAKANYLAVRGPRTRDLIIKAGGQCPEVYGDPGLLLPMFIEPSEKDTLIGVVPHHSEMFFFKDKVFPGVKIIDPRTNDVEKIVKEITSCKYIVASSLHGIIIANAYNIPVAWVHFIKDMASQKFKYEDYFESIGYSKEKSMYLNPSKDVIDFKEVVKKQGIKYNVGLDLTDLINVCPFDLNIKTDE